MQLSDFVTQDQIARLRRPTEIAEMLPGSIYSPEFYRFENEKLLPYTWAAVAAGGDLPNPGDAYPLMFGDWPIVLVRTKTRAIKGFLNICRHRRMRLVTKPTNAPMLACPWHCWTYDLDGKLRATPHASAHGDHHLPKGFSAEKLGLKAVQVGVWNDVIFINIDGGVLPFAEFRRPLDLVFKNFALEDAVFGASYDHYYDADWKVSMEGGIENYHIPWGHPQTLRGVTSRPQQFQIYPPYGVSMTEYVTYESDAAARLGFEYTDPNGAVSSLADLRRDTSVPCTTQIQLIMHVFPTAALTVSNTQAMFAMFIPDGIGRTRLALRLYVAPESLRDPSYAETLRTTMDYWCQTIAPQDQDFVRYVGENHRVSDLAGIKSRMTPNWEVAVHHFQKMLIEQIQARESITGTNELERQQRLKPDLPFR